jgi:hypothetical protein
MSERGWYASLADGVVKALSGAFILAVGYLMRASEEEKRRLKDEIEHLRKMAEVRRRQSDPAEHDRVRTRFENRDL